MKRTSQQKGFMLSSSVLTGCVTIFKRSVLDTVGAIGLVCNHTVCQSSRRVLDRRLYVVATPPGQRTSIHCELCGGFSENSWREGNRGRRVLSRTLTGHKRFFELTQAVKSSLPVDLWRSFIKLEITPISQRDLKTILHKIHTVPQHKILQFTKNEEKHWILTLQSSAQ